MSLFQKRGENMSLLFQKENFKKTTTTAEISTTTTITTTTMKTPIEPVILFWKLMNWFFLRATFSFLSFRIRSKKVICKAATDLLKLMRRLTRRKTIMLIVRLSLLWKENFTFLAEIMTATRYCFVWLIKITRLKRNPIIEFKNNSQDCEFERLLFQQTSGATQRNTKLRSRGSFNRKWPKR